MPRLAAPLDPAGMALLAALLAGLLVPPLVPYELGWEVAASLGYAACAALLLTFRVAPVLPGSMTSYRFTLHRVAGDAAMALALGHVAVMLATDPFVWDYLGWLMPIHVLLGVLAAAGLLLVVATREPVVPARWRVGGRRLHAWLGIAAAALTAAHAVTSTTKAIDPWRPALLAAPLLLVLLPPLARLTAGGPPPPGREPTPPIRAAVLQVLALLGLVAVVLVAAPRLWLWLVARG